MAEKQTIVARLAERVRAERERLGISQAELARRAGLSRSQILAIERAERASTIVTLETVAMALGCSAADLITEHGLNAPDDLPGQVAATLRRVAPDVAGAVGRVVAALEQSGRYERRRRPLR